MSLVFCKNDDRSVQDDRHSNLLPYRFTSYFTNPIHIPKNSQVAYISSQFTLNKNGGISGNPFYMVIGNPALNMPVPIIPTKEFVSNWAEQTSFLAELANSYNPDGDYNNISSTMDEEYKGILQKTFVHYDVEGRFDYAGINMLYTEEDKVDIIATPRPFAASQFNQGFNCLGRNTKTITYSDGYVSPPGINEQDADIVEAELLREDAKGLEGGRWSRTTQFFQPEVNQAPNMNDTGNTDANFYNTQYTLDTLLNDDYLWGNFPATALELPDFDENAFSITCSSTGIKKFIGDETPKANGGGHEGIGGGPVKSGGYALYGFANQSKTAADTHFDAAYVGSSSDIGFCGIAEQFVGVQSIPFIQHFAENLVNPESRDFQDALEQFSTNVDVNASVNEDIPEGMYARYVLGIRIKEEEDDAGNGTLVAQAEILDPQNGTLEDSKYIDVGEKLDIKKLSNGINSAVTPEYQFDSVNQYVINTYNDSSPRLKANLLFRFRWSSPYTMAIDYTMPVLTEPLSYNLKTDVPYHAPAAPTRSVSVPLSTVVHTHVINNSSNNTLNGVFRDSDVLNMQDIDGNGNPAERVELSLNKDAVSNSAVYRTTFDAGEGFSCKIKMNDWLFAQTFDSGGVKERLGFEVSNDGVNFVQFTGVPWFLETNPPNPFVSAGIDVRMMQFKGSVNGTILPQTPAIASSSEFDPTFTAGDEILTSHRYMRVMFSYNNPGTTATLDLHISTNQEPNSAPPNVNADPTKGWVVLYDMLDDYTTEDSFYIPSYFGDMGLVSYHIADNHSHYTKGYYDVRRSYRYIERLQEGLKSADRYTSLDAYTHFFKTNLYMESLLQKNDSGVTTPKLVGVTPDLFVGDRSMPVKDVQFLVNTIRDTTSTELIRDVQMNKRFEIGEPQNLDIGFILGWTQSLSKQSVIQLTDDSGTGQFEFIGKYDLNINDNAFTNHVQIGNLPIQSQNGVVSSQNKTIYVFSAMDVNNILDINDERVYSHSSPQLLWIDLNNLEDLTLNKLDIHITNDQNISQKLLVGSTNVVLMFRQKSVDAAGYLPNQIKVNPMNNLIQE